ncbi:hypothetical protein D3C81_742070 [compost metagenome]
MDTHADELLGVEYTIGFQQFDERNNGFLFQSFVSHDNFLLRIEYCDLNGLT